MALVLVLWIVAALSIFASSLGRMVRQEAAVIGVTRNMAEGRAMGEAAIYQLLQQMVLKPAEFSQYQVVQLPWAGRIIEVEVVPWSGLVDINAASQPLLSTLISRLGGGAGEGIAQALVDARQEARQAAASGFAWESPEDLLQIPGMNYGIYARLKPFVVADIDGRPGVNANAAAPALRQLLDGSTGQDSTNSTRYRLTARTVFDGQGAVMVMRDVDIGGGSQGALPWTLLSAAQVWAGRV
ncbi:MAG: general secretion pathway protein GspK [Burkholderiaceae bacterium]|jgi:general secretion pathway protein K|nr:general secretion pathway protein GspK [Burkholderiaceae bacterium]